MDIAVTPALFYDAAMLAVLVLIIWIGYRKGFVSMLLRTVGTVAAAVIAALASSPVSEWIYRSFFEARVTEYVSNQVENLMNGLSDASLQAMASLETMQQTLVESISGILDATGLNISFFSGAGSTESLANSILDQIEQGVPAAEALAETAIEPAILMLLSMGVFLLSFLLLLIFVRVLAGIGKGINQVPVIGGVNRLLGFGLGVIYAGIIGYLLTLLLVFAAGLTGDSFRYFNTTVLQDTYLLSWFMGIRF